MRITPRLQIGGTAEFDLVPPVAIKPSYNLLSIT